MLQSAVDSGPLDGRVTRAGQEVVMQQIARRIFFVIAVLFAVPVVAGNIGFLDTERAIRSTQEGRQQMRVLDAWANQRADEIEALRDRVNEIAQELNTQRTIATDEVISALERDFVAVRRELEDAGRALQRDLEAKRAELLAQVATRVRNISSEYAEANGFDAILMFETTPLVYVKDSAIITDQVIRLYDQRYPVN
jgi:Skp family chaperone for outer membrane proteins